jgi:hypothetical protein
MIGPKQRGRRRILGKRVQPAGSQAHGQPSNRPTRLPGAPLETLPPRHMPDEDLLFVRQPWAGRRRARLSKGKLGAAKSPPAALVSRSPAGVAPLPGAGISIHVRFAAKIGGRPVWRPRPRLVKVEVTFQRETAMRYETEHPAAPEQVEHGFDEGVGRRPRAAAQRRIGRFSDGIESRPDENRTRRRFSEGIEERPDSPHNMVERRFSEGLDRSTTST